ncbi:MAG TPA: hypothetical protein VKE69_06830 [Planctomycetota bacterium]|nr:hypothetical protein [Planctomycetota bacterium]
MPISTGTVEHIKFGDDFGFFALNNVAEQKLELFILWFGAKASPGPVALYTMLVTTAATQKLTIDVSHGATSAFVDQLVMHAQP